MARGTWARIAFVAALLWAETSTAAAPAVSLDYLVSAEIAGCPDANALEAAIRERLGRDPFTDPADYRMTCTISAEGQHVRARIEIGDGAGATLGSREVASRTCPELMPSVVLVLAMAIEGLPSVMAARPPQEPAPALPPVDESQASATPTTSAASGRAPVSDPDDPDAPVALELTSRATAARRGYLRAGTHLAIGSAPSPTMGLTLQGGVSGRRFVKGLELRVDAPAAHAFGGGEVSATPLGLYLLGCIRHRSLAACGLLGGGTLVGAGRGLVNGRTVVTPFADLGARLEWGIALSARMSARVHLDFHAPLTRTTLLVSGEEAWTTPAASGAIGLALARTFR